MKPITVAFLVVFSLGIAAGKSGAIATEPQAPASDAAKPAAEPEPEAKKEKKLRLPPGFREKKRGKYVLYCKKDAPMGTRLKSEVCLSEEQLRDYLLALEQGKVDTDRTRAICSNPCFCGMPC